MSGTITDSLVRAPIIRAMICREFNVGPPYGSAVRCAWTDSLGTFALDSLAAGDHPLIVSCYGSTPMGGKRLATFTVSLTEIENRELSLNVDGTGCDQRPLIVTRQTWHGYYSYGFEESHFAPLENRNAHIWVSCGKACDRPESSSWPEFTPGESYPCVYVEWEGTMTGPGVYGHLGVSTYELVVHRVLVVRKADGKECGRAWSN